MSGWKELSILIGYHAIYQTHYLSTWFFFQWRSYNDPLSLFIFETCHFFLVSVLSVSKISIFKMEVMNKAFSSHSFDSLVWFFESFHLENLDGWKVLNLLRPITVRNIAGNIIFKEGDAVICQSFSVLLPFFEGLRSISMCSKNLSFDFTWISCLRLSVNASS